MRSWLSGNLGKTALRLIEIVRMYYDTSLKTSRRDWSELSSPGRLSRFLKPPFSLFFSKKLSNREMEESDGDSSTQRTTGSDTAEGMEERAIWAMPIVTTLSFVRAVKDKARGVRVTLTCYNCREYGSCEKPQEAPIHLTKERTTMHACLHEERTTMQARSCANDCSRIMATALKLLLKKLLLMPPQLLL